MDLKDLKIDVQTPETAQIERSFRELTGILKKLEDCLERLDDHDLIDLDVEIDLKIG